jgi:probable addiction module antidote protein
MKQTVKTVEEAEFTLYDAADSILSPEDVRAHLAAAFEDGSPGVIAQMIGAVARSKGMGEVAAQTGLNRESLYRALSPKGNPTLSTTLQVLDALGYKLSLSAKS